MLPTPRARRPLLPLAACLALLTAAAPARAQADAGWTGNLAKNPGFEEDFVNNRGEGHVLSFKGDWWYNQKDLVPDYWDLQGGWTWATEAPHAGRHTLKLAAGATAKQAFIRAVSQEGGGAWGGAVNKPIPDANPAKFAQPWRVSAWCRGSGTVTLTCGKGSASATAKGGNAWEKVTAELAAEHTADAAAPVVVTLQGPGEFDDVVVQEKLSDSPNLVANGGFEKVDRDGAAVGWSGQKKYRAAGPTYYVWTDWNHYFRENRGRVGVDPLLPHSGKYSLRFDVLPGDEKYVESDLILLNQDKAHVIEVGAYVRADRINLIDLRCVDEEGVYMPGYRPRQAENGVGGTDLYGNGTFGWRYVRKFFATPHGRAVKGIRVRLCARGMNGHALDDADTRSYAMATGTVWWDDVRVTERTSTAADLQGRGVKVPPAEAAAPGPVGDADLDLGQRFFGENALTYAFANTGPAGMFQLRVTTTLPDGKPVTTTSAAAAVPAGQRGSLSAAYTLDGLAGELEKQGRLHVELLRDGKPAAETSYAFNTWPVIVDIDVSRHYNLPAENPVTTSLNLGVADGTLAKVKKLELQLYRPSDKKVLGTQSFADLNKAFADTLAALPKTKEASYEFNLPTPAWWVDRTNLIVTRLDLSPLKVWPHDQPTRDTVLIVRGYGAGDRELFRQQSDPFGRMEAPPKQAEVKKVDIRDDGVVLINGEPRYLTGATHQHVRLMHTYSVVAQLGLMGHRMPQGPEGKFEALEKLWADHHLYALQMKPVSGQVGTEVVVDLKPEQRAALEKFVAAGGMKNVVSINTGGWEAIINVEDKKAVDSHVALNDYLRKLTNRPIAVSTSGAYNAWWLNTIPFYDINHAETEMWGPMDFNVCFTPYMKKLRKTPTAWVYLPQLYDNTPYERYRFETYENIIRGSAGVSMIQGIGDATFNRGLAGELRYLEKRLTRTEKAPAVTLDPPCRTRSRGIRARRISSRPTRGRSSSATGSGTRRPSTAARPATRGTASTPCGSGPAACASTASAACRCRSWSRRATRSCSTSGSTRRRRRSGQWSRCAATAASPTTPSSASSTSRASARTTATS